MITYKAYPTLLFLSYDRDNAPAELPFGVPTPELRDELAKSSAFSQLFGLIANLNGEGHSPRHFYLNNKKFNDVEYSLNFRNIHFSKFLNSPPVKTQYGAICFPDGGQYVYLFIPDVLAGRLKQVEGSYLGAALFRNNIFIGFEEGILNSNLEVLPNGVYPPDTEPGVFLSFAAICLGFFCENLKPLPDSLNNTREEIWSKS